MEARIAHRYALALMGIGREKKSVETLSADLNVIAETLHGSGELRSMLHMPIVGHELKRKVLEELFKSRVSSDMMTFIDLLVKKGRAGVLGTVATEFQRLLDEQNNTVTAEITSAVELTDSAKKQIVAKLEQLTKKIVRASFRIDASLRGGFVAKVGDTLIDASLAHQLENLREEFTRVALARVN